MLLDISVEDKETFVCVFGIWISVGIGISSKQDNYIFIMVIFQADSSHLPTEFYKYYMQI